MFESWLPIDSEARKKRNCNARVAPGTFNKQLGAVQAISEWAFANGVIPEDTSWTNPFAKMRVEGEDSERTSFENPDLKLLFAAPVFTEHEYPEGGRGPAAFWLPLLSLFNGARQTELASLTVADVQTEPETSTPLFYITTQASRGKRLKTKAGEGLMPLTDFALVLRKFVERGAEFLELEKRSGSQCQQKSGTDKPVMLTNAETDRPIVLRSRTEWPVRPCHNCRGTKNQ
jgi:integrase